MALIGDDTREGKVLTFSMRHDITTLSMCFGLVNSNCKFLSLMADHL